MAGNTPWCGLVADKLYLQSGEFSATMKDSQATAALNPQAISWDGTNTPWTTSTGDKLWLQSGQFSGTVKQSVSVTLIDNSPEGISWDGTNTPWAGISSDKHYLQSGQFSVTLKTSRIAAYVTNRGISFDSPDTPWCESSTGDKLILQSGQFSATMKTSLDVQGIDSSITDIAWDQTDTPWVGTLSDKLYLQSGQFSGTLKTSLSVTGVDTDPRGIENTNRLAAAGLSAAVMMVSARMFSWSGGMIGRQDV